MHAIVGLSQYDIACIAKGVATDRGIEKPTIVSDCSNMAYIYKKNCIYYIIISKSFRQVG